MIDLFGNYGIHIAFEPHVTQLPKNELLEKRYGRGNYPSNRTYPIAFTRAQADVSYKCFCDGTVVGPQVVGAIEAPLEINTYIYIDTDPVVITSNLGEGKGTKEDVYRHEEEHARDCKEIFHRICSESIPKNFFTLTECNQQMKQEASMLEQQLQEAFDRYFQTGHEDSKFQRGGAFFVEGNYK